MEIWDGLRLQAATAYASGQLQDALSLFQAALQAMPVDCRRARVLVHISQIYSRLGKDEDASRSLHSAADLDLGILHSAAALGVAKAVSWFQSQDFLAILGQQLQRPVQLPVVVVESGGHADCTSVEQALFLLHRQQRKGKKKVKGTIALLPGTYVGVIGVKGHGVIDIVGVGADVIIEGGACVQDTASVSWYNLTVVTAKWLQGIVYGDKSSGEIRGCKVLATSNDNCVACGCRSVVRICSSEISGRGNGLHLEHDARVTCEDVVIHNLTGDGILVQQNARATLKRCEVSRTGGDGVFVSNLAELVLSDCKLQLTGSACSINDRCPKAAVQMGGGRAILERCSITDHYSIGIHGQDAAHVSASDCTVARCGLQGDDPACATLVFRRLSSADFTRCTLEPIGRLLISVVLNGAGHVRFDGCAMEGGIIATPEDRQPDGDTTGLEKIRGVLPAEVLDPSAAKALLQQEKHYQTNDQHKNKRNRICLYCGHTERSMEKYLKRGGRTFLVCGKCRVAHYCSADCQAKHWPVHKQTCKRNVALRQVASAAEA